jgi:hypothetical protein
MTFAHLYGNDWIPFSKKLPGLEAKYRATSFFDTFNFLKSFMAEEVLHRPEQMII